MIEQKDLIEIVCKSLEKSPESRISFVVSELKQRYGNKINDSSPEFFVVIGGAYGVVKILYASLTEYLILYGCPFKNSGTSGRYLFRATDFVIRGKLNVAPVIIGERATEFKEGEYSTLQVLENRFYEIDENTWLLEHATGFIPSSFFSVFGHFMSTWDILGTFAIFKTWLREVLRTYAF
jgi:C-8 sterol isomerase